MKKIRIYRGITLNESNVDDVVSKIQNDGLDIVRTSQWSGGFVWNDLRNDLPRLLNKTDLSLDDTSPESVWVKTDRGGHREYISGNIGVCFADRGGANYYAFHHNVTENNKIPVVIEAEVSINNVAIDGRDFLYTVFGFLARESVEKVDRKKRILSKIFGEKIITYIDKVIQNPECDALAVCDLAIIDDDIIECHHKNQVLIEGRCRTKFKNAFYVKTPINSESIKDISINKYFSENSNDVVSLNQILER